MQVVVISDTHNRHDYVHPPPGDLLIHCGDWTTRGLPHEMLDFLQWFGGLKYKHKILIPGNHELTLDDSRLAVREAAAQFIVEEVHKHTNLHYLNNSSVEIEGIKFYGTPTTPWFHDWAFNFERGPKIAAEWDKIPLDTNVLISHGPPYGILDLVEDTKSNKGRDLHQGCEDLKAKLKELKQLKAHVFGHLHTCGGKLETIDGVIYGNAAICTESYNPSNPPIFFDL